MWILALIYAATVIWLENTPAKPAQYRAKDKSNRRIIW